MLWVETGADDPEWERKPIQIGVPGDPGLMSLLSGREGGDRILPPSWKGLLTPGSVRAIPAHNIRAGIAYLLMRMAKFEHGSVVGADKRIYEVSINPGDSFDRVAKTQGTTVDILKKLNPTANTLRPGHSLKYQKASVQRVIVGWRPISATSIAQRYNGGGDPNYAKKLDLALELVRNRRTTLCGQ
ncbi:LysM domain-containing protein [Trinickia dinghuensis]|uniref:LysM domain-containing protein n=2 Tax=Trinickia dinghuensis TaxID=2291023 RepID=A0A3D8JQ10_9BURK|nr:LysM domain-containing protein [Trinickia dinghuensis]